MRQEAAKIRAGRREDAPAIAEVHLEARRESLPWLPELHSRDETISYFADDVLIHEEVFVADMRRQVVGFIALKGDHVDHLYIAPAWQRHGLGGRLLAIAKELRPRGLTLWTFQRNSRARQFYEARGFVAAEFGDRSRNEEGEPDVLYRWVPEGE